MVGKKPLKWHFLNNGLLTPTNDVDTRRLDRYQLVLVEELYSKGSYETDGPQRFVAAMTRSLEEPLCLILSATHCFTILSAT